MQELEKILQEIDCRFENLLITDDECRKTALSKHDYEKVKYYRTGIVFTERAMDIVKDIIIKHMSGKDIDVLANDGWVPVDEQLPEEGETVLCTDGDYVYLVEYDADLDAPFGDIDNIIGWQPSPEPYRPERGTKE